jgi:hypothetical protein
MKSKSLKLTMIVLFLCIISFFTANNALAAWSTSSVTMSGLNIYKLTGLTYTPVSVTYDVKTSWTDAWAYDDVTSPHYAPVATSTVYSGDPLPVALGVQTIATKTSPFDYAYARGYTTYDANTSPSVSVQATAKDVHGNESGAEAFAKLVTDFQINSSSAGTYLLVLDFVTLSQGFANHKPDAWSKYYTNLTMDIWTSNSYTHEYEQKYYNSYYPEKAWTNSSEGIYGLTLNLGANAQGTLELNLDSWASAYCPTSVPLPASLMLLAPGLLGLAGLRKRISK